MIIFNTNVFKLSFLHGLYEVIVLKKLCILYIFKLFILSKSREHLYKHFTINIFYINVFLRWKSFYISKRIFFLITLLQKEKKKKCGQTFFYVFYVGNHYFTEKLFFTLILYIIWNVRNFFFFISVFIGNYYFQWKKGFVFCTFLKLFYILFKSCNIYTNTLY